MMPKKTLLTHVVIPIAIVVMAIVIAATLVVSRPQATIREAEEKSWVVSVVEASPRAISPQITLYGKVESPNVTRLTAAVNADVDEVRVKEGQDVQRGQLLVKLNDADYQLQLKQRQAELADIKAQISSELDHHKSNLQALKHEQALLRLAKKELDRTKSLKTSNLSTQAQIDESEQLVVKQELSVNSRQQLVDDHSARLRQLKARATRAEALRDLAALEVKRARITAPFTGKVTSVNVSPGDRVKTGDELLELYDHNTLEIRAQIPTQYESIIQQTLSSSSDSTVNGFALLNDQRLPVSLDRISGKISRGSGGLDGLFHINADHTRLPLGRTLALNLSLAPVQNAIAVPRESIYGSNRIYRLVGERMSSLDVQRIGEMHDADGNSQVIIKSPELNAGDKIISTQLPNAVDGLLVDVATNPS
ncbi:MAG: biotin/lipoyl-binding protein [Gammaproteobacteria bacterium]|jgi:multidrug efflux pump subunit AcrA (membrane-fusion protein)